MKMKLEEFVKHEKQLLDHFEAWWKSNHQSYPAGFPLTLDEGDWYEQLTFFNGDEKEKESEG